MSWVPSYLADLEVHHVPDHCEFVEMRCRRHLRADPRDLQRFAAAIPLQNRRHLDVGDALVFEPSEPQAPLQAETDLCRHVGKFLLDEPIGSKRPAELLAIEYVLPGRGKTRLRLAERAPDVMP